MRRLFGMGALILAACGEDPTASAPPRAPEIFQTVAEASSSNVLSVVVTVQVGGADSVAVQYGLTEAPDGMLTPAATIDDAVMELPVLGLYPEKSYRFRAVAYGRGGVSIGPSVEVLTGKLPPDLPVYVAGGPEPSPGFVVFAAGAYGIVIDNTGRVVWYHRFPDTGPGLNFMAQPNGRYAARPPAATPGGPTPWMELDELGRVIRTLDCAGGLGARFHDLLARPDGSYWLLCDESRIMDLSAYGGHAAATVIGTAVQHVAADGEILFQWSPFDHFDIAEADSAELVKPAVNWTHGNSLDIDPEGNVLVSFRNLGEVTRIDGRTGVVLWRLGGAANQFAIEGSDAPPFRGQHSVRSLPDGALSLLDNVGETVGSRAERYSIREAGLVARLTGFAASEPAVITVTGGSVQSLPGGRTLVSYGTAGRVEEYDAAGRVVWRIEGNAGYVFRAQRIASLYSPGVGTPR